MVLAAAVEAAADLDMQVFDWLIELKTLLAKPLVQLSRQATRRRNAQFAGVGSRAAHDVDDGTGAGIAQSCCNQCSVKFGQIAFTNPADGEVLFHRRPDRLERKPPNDVGQLAQL